MPEHTIADCGDEGETDGEGGETLAMHESFTVFTMTPDWLLDHPGISGEALKLWTIICSYAGKERTAFPKVATLAARLRKSRQSIFNYLNELEAAGALQRQQRYRSDGGRTSTTYVLAWAHPFHDSPVSSMTPPHEAGCTGGCTAGCTGGCKAGCTPRTRSSVLTRSSEKQNTRAQPTHVKRVRDSSADADGVFSLSDFDAFWALYPKKVGKPDARKAWTKAIKTTGGPGPIMAGLYRTRFSMDREFIPYPASWLNGQRWNDEDDYEPDGRRSFRIESPTETSIRLGKERAAAEDLAVLEAKFALEREALSAKVREAISGGRPR